MDADSEPGEPTLASSLIVIRCLFSTFENAFEKASRVLLLLDWHT